MPAGGSEQKPASRGKQAAEAPESVLQQRPVAFPTPSSGGDIKRTNHRALRGDVRTETRQEDVSISSARAGRFREDRGPFGCRHEHQPASLVIGWVLPVRAA